MISKNSMRIRRWRMNKAIMEAVGFSAEMKRIEAGFCPTCGKDIGKFRDALSKREYEISGMCQLCQDDVFGGGEG
jgi:hypothetical protein